MFRLKTIKVPTGLKYQIMHNFILKKMENKKIRILNYICLTQLFLCITVNWGFSQNYETKQLRMVLTDIERNKRRIPVDIFYPVDSEVSLTRSAGIAPKYPLVCFGHGYLITGKWYYNLVEMLVPKGFILIFPASEASLFPSHNSLAKDMKFALNEVYKLSGDSTSLLYNRIDTLKCLMGHSMGGGTAFLAASYCSDINAIVTFAPYDTRPSAVKAASNVRVPTLIFAGSNDCITPPAKYQIPIYNSTASNEKTLILIKGGTHCQMGVSHPKCSFGEKIAGCNKNNIREEDQLRIIERYIIPWLKFHLYNDLEAKTGFNNAIRNDASIEFMQFQVLPDGDYLDKLR